MTSPSAQTCSQGTAETIDPHELAIICLAFSEIPRDQALRLVDAVYSTDEDGTPIAGPAER